MRYCDFGLQPSANHATSASRVAIGVISIWSRAILVTNHLDHERWGTMSKGRTLTGGESKGNGRPPHHLGAATHRLKSGTAASASAVKTAPAMNVACGPTASHSTPAI